MTAANFPSNADVGPGWAPLIRDLVHELAEVHPCARLERVRERWGLLVADVAGFDDESEYAERIRAVLETYRQRSATVCEVSGRPGLLMVSPEGWFRTLDPISAPKDWSIVDNGPPAPAEHLMRVIVRMHRSQGR